MRKTALILFFIFFISSFSLCPILYAESLESIPHYSFQEAIRETVFVETPFSASDRIAVDFIRPKETEHGLTVPVIMDASPYYERLGRGNEHEIKKYDKSGKIIKFPLFYDNYFVPRGYAVVQPDLIGTNYSDGCPTIGGKEDIEGIKAVIDWLNGRARAWDKNGNEKKATWTNGKVGMIGKSYDGALADGVASTGVDGLMTVVSIGGVTNWYDWFRYGGLIQKGRRVDWLAETVSSRSRVNECSDHRNRLRQNADDVTGNYNSFWEERNYLKNGNKIKASMFVVQGLNDFNVTMNHASQWWRILTENNIPRKLWLSQTGHVDPFDFRREKWVSTLQQWFDYWLLGIQNGIMSEPKVDIEHAPDVWDTYDNWPDANAQSVNLYLSSQGDDSSGKITLEPPSGNPEQSYVDDPYQTEEERVDDEDSSKEGRLLFLSPKLTKILRISGTPKIAIQAKVNKKDTNITALLVDYGMDTRVDHEDPKEGITTLSEKDCWGDSTQADTACYYKTKKKLHKKEYEVITRGWFSARHWKSISQIDYLSPGEWYTFHWDILPEDYVFKEGHRMGILITGSDSERMSASTTRATVTINLGKSLIALPIVGGENAIGF